MLRAVLQQEKDEGGECLGGEGGRGDKAAAKMRINTGESRLKMLSSSMLEPRRLGLVFRTLLPPDPGL